jgi:hypothetical protein
VTCRDLATAGWSSTITPKDISVTRRSLEDSAADARPITPAECPHAHSRGFLVARQARTALKSENDREGTQAFLSLLAADKFEWEKKHRHKPDINHQIVQIDWSQFVASSEKQKTIEAQAKRVEQKDGTDAGADPG